MTTADGARLAYVGVGGQEVPLCFYGDLTPVEVVAAFLRDLADTAGEQPADGLLRDVADQLDEP